jgi:hypothetical protein
MVEHVARLLDDRHCERSEAIQSNKRGLDCFVASAPRNDVDRSGRESVCSPRAAPELCIKHPPIKTEGTARPSRRGRRGMPSDAAASTASHPNVRDDGQRPSYRDGTARDVGVIAFGEAECFCGQGVDG